jgi:TolB-like protein/Tfp pilus assembly protein PilF
MVERRLESWKEIAVYLQRGVRTVRRWETDEGLPVHRLAHRKQGTVFAYPSELDTWRESRRVDRNRTNAGTRSPRTLPRRTMIAVLPFADLGGTAEFLANGLQEEMISYLGRLSPSALGVIARTTMMSYKADGRPLRRIAEELKVDYVVEGSVRRERHRVRVTARLIDASDQTDLWSNTYDETLRSILVLQRNLAMDITAGIRPALTARFPEPRSGADRVDSAAYEAHLEGRSLLTRFTPDAVRRSIDAFQRAIAADPAYAPAYASLAEAHQQLSVWTEVPPSSALPVALEAARHALRLDPELPEAHASLGLINATYLWKWDEAERSFCRALELNPGCSPAGQWYGEFLAAMGRFDDAARIVDAALAHDPISPAILATKAFVLWMGRRFDEAVDQAEAVLDIDPAYPMALIRLGVACAGQGDWARAIRAFRRAVSAAPELPASHGLLGYAYGMADNRLQALAALEKLAHLQETRYVPALPFGMVHLGLGEMDTAIRYLESEYENRGWSVLLLNQAPQFDPLRGIPRFDAVVRRLRLPG